MIDFYCWVVVAPPAVTMQIAQLRKEAHIFLHVLIDAIEKIAVYVQSDTAGNLNNGPA